MSPLQNPSDGETILIVDDTPANLDLLARTLEPRGYRILAAPNAEVALSIAAKVLPDLVLLDVLLPDMSGFEICRRLQAKDATRHIPVLFISARSETTSLVEGFQAGGLDYIAKPIDPDEVVMRVQTHLRVSQLTRQLREKNTELTAANDLLRSEMERRQQVEIALKKADEQLSSISAQEAERWGMKAFIGSSRLINGIIREVRRLQNFSSVNVLITGESGTGKELVARALHFGSTRASGPFIPVNCVAIPSELAESMLFGHVRGAFTGASIDRKGLFELAHGGTLFLDEIGDMPSPLQAKLLRVLEDGRIMPLGASKEKEVNVRIVAATNSDLRSQIATGSFRRDLYFRLAQFPVHLPPLRERVDDISLLSEHFLQLFAREMGMPTIPSIATESLKLLMRHPFTGNVRELKNVIERALIESGGATILPQHLHLNVGVAPARAIPSGSTESDDLPLNLEAAEDLLIRRALAQTSGNIAEAARRLGINRTRIYRKLGGHAQGTVSQAD